MTTIPKISVIVPVYNTEKYLNACLDSIIDQTFKDIEIICVDDGSTDNSMAILKEYSKKDERIIILKQKNGGSSTARNAGLKKANGEYIHFIDSDDFCDPDMYETLYKSAAELKPDMLIFTFKRYDHQTNEFIMTFSNRMNIPQEKIFSYKTFPNNIFFSTTPSACTKLFKNEFIKQNNLSFNPNIMTAEDAAFTYPALLTAKSIIYFDVPFYSYRVNRPFSKTSMNAHQAGSLLRAWKSIINFAKQKDLNIPEHVIYHIYSAAASSLRYNYTLAKQQNNGAYFILKCRNFLPSKYWLMFLEKEKINPPNKFIAVINDGNFKHISVFNFIFKIKRGKKGRKPFKTAANFIKSYFLFPWYMYKTYKILDKLPARNNKKK